MKSIIVYYSYTGNTKKVAQDLKEILTEKGEIDSIELSSIDEAKSFLGQCRRAFFKKRAQIAPVNLDLSKYDLICLGTPVWAFKPAPAMNTYLDKCSGVEGKEIILFTTYGSGRGNEQCLNYMQGILAKKGATNFRRFSVQQGEVNNKESVLSEIKSAIS